MTTAQAQMSAANLYVINSQMERILDRSASYRVDIDARITLFLNSPAIEALLSTMLEERATEALGAWQEPYQGDPDDLRAKVAHVYTQWQSLTVFLGDLFFAEPNFDIVALIFATDSRNLCHRAKSLIEDLEFLLEYEG